MNLMKQVQARPISGARLTLLAVAACAALMLAGCGSDKDKASQTAAKVNKEEITVHQINFVLEHQQGLKPDQVEAAGRQVLERLIDQQLAVQKAEDLKLDRDPAVVEQMEAAKAEIIARSYATYVGNQVAKPTPEEVSKYYDENPALFKERRIYSLQEFLVEAKPEQFDAIRSKLTGAKNISEFVDYLKSSGIHFNGSQAVRPAEQLPLSSLNAIAHMKNGDSAVMRMPNGLNIVYLADSRDQPVTLDQARPAIEQFIGNQRKMEAVKKDIKALRDAAKIEYVGKFAEAAASAPAAVAAPAAPVESSSAASGNGMDSADIKKGLGIK